MLFATLKKGLLQLNVSLEQPMNAPLPISVTPSGMTIDRKDEQQSNAQSPISVTPSGITIDCKEEQFENA